MTSMMSSLSTANTVTPSAATAVATAPAPASSAPALISSTPVLSATTTMGTPAPQVPLSTAPSSHGGTQTQQSPSPMNKMSASTPLSQVTPN